MPVLTTAPRLFAFRPTGSLGLDRQTSADHWFASDGLTGKIIGPLALLAHVTAGNWPATALTIIVSNDLVWWLPFALYLHDAHRSHPSRTHPQTGTTR